MSEQEQHITAESVGQQVDQMIDVASLKKVDMTVEDFARYSELDSDDPEITELLAQYDLKAGERVIVSASDEDDARNGFDRVVVAGGLDSFTTDRQLTDELNTRLLESEGADMRSNLERAERIVPGDDIKELGDVALGAAGVEAPTPVEEHEKSPFGYLRDLLPPVTRPDRQPENLDHLYGSQEEYERVLASLQLTKAEQEQQKYYDTFVTEENKQSSRQTLTDSLKVNSELGRVLREAGVDVASMDAIDAIRENADVRYETAKYFARKLEDAVIRDPQAFGWRIADNMSNNLKEDQQRPGHKMMSRDYVVSLALKMLGGEFSDRHADDWLDRDETGRVVLGQHRDAARQILLYR